jgi:polyene macrolide polyketide synthase
LTAYYGLVDLAGVGAGEKVLVHAAAGGVGMAAVQLARYRGAEVFATASPAKHAVLREMGLAEDHIGNSRTLDFPQRFLAGTGGAGMDVVLDCLADEFVDASLGLLPRGGRFLEMGKLDIRDATEVAAAHPGVRYQAFDLAEAGTDRIGQMLRELMRLFQAGALQLLPVKTWPVQRAPGAFRYMAQARHIGKNVLTFPRALDPAGTVIITGGTGGLGAEVARHVVRAHGVRSVLLASRRGMDAEGAAQLCEQLRGLGARVVVVACDVAEREQVRTLLVAVPVDAPVTGIVHTAGVFDDGVITALDAAQLDRVLRPKADAVVHLDEFTRGMDLAAFVLFSSISGVLGGAGQGNYAAANAFLDAVALRRRVAGEAAVSLAWGLWAETRGMAGRLDTTDHERLVRSGMTALDTAQGMRLLDTALSSPRAALVPAVLNVAVLRSHARSGVLPAMLREVVGRVRRSAMAGSAAGGWVARLAGLDTAARLAALLELVRAEAGVVVGGGEAVGATRAFRDAGFDSLTAVELRNRLSTATGVRLPATVVFDYPNPTALAGYLHAELLGDLAPAVVLPARVGVADDPIVIVGMGVRLPGGVDSPQELWELLRRGGDAVTDFPVDRGWDIKGLYHPDPDAVGTSYTRSGGFLRDAGLFDPGFFGISPREALAMDPQQRLLLETSWEAVERAGIDPTSLRGQNVGVFTGMCRARQSRWTRRVRRRWWRCIWRRRRCGRVSARWRWPVGSR